jgi:hypothetical protein
MSESKEPRQVRKSDLALAVAQGTSVAKWRRKHNVPARTAYRWSSDPEVRASVQTIRRRYLDRAAGILARNATSAVTGILKLGKKAKSESVKLSALRAVLSDYVDVTNFSTLEGRVAEVEEQIHERDSKQAASADRAG